jgi:hypothetical protein
MHKKHSSPHSAAAISAPEPPRPPARWRRVLLWTALASLAVGGLVCADWWICLPDDVQATYVGRQSCIECHRQQYDDWQGSHHDLAMDLATPETVLGDFNDAEFEQFGIHSRLFRRDGKYWVHTEGADGEMADFEVKWVFGVKPLQQYMVEFDRPPDMPAHEIARVQVLRICWDTERKEWFYLHPPDVRERLAPDDDLHWTGVAQRWNNMCADCHSTNLQKNFNVATNTYHTTFSEIDVSCEACHGPASIHVDLANRKSLFWDRKRGYGLVDLNSDAQTLIESCAPCHSRRSHVYPDYLPGNKYCDHFNSELLLRTTYHADGQILDEVYEYASFIQSKMYHQGIRCTDCHDPHKAKLKHPDNALCTSCHQHPAGKYDSPSHHFHQPDSTGASCVECHMPQTTYMEVHPRRDHSIRNPRPDLSVQLGTPNACTRCHLDKEKAGLQDRDDLKQYLDWILAARDGDEQVRAVLAGLDQEMDKAYQEWYGKQHQPERRFDKYFAPILDAARRGDPEAEKGLVRVAGDARLPTVVRATALLELGVVGFQVGRPAQRLLGLVKAAMQVQQHAVAVLDERGIRRQAGVAGEQFQFVLAEPGGFLSQPVRLGGRLVPRRGIASCRRLCGAALLHFDQPVVQGGQIGSRAARARLDVQGVLVRLDGALVLVLVFGQDRPHDMRSGPVVVDDQAAFQLGQRAPQLLPLGASQQPVGHAAQNASRLDPHQAERIA